MARKVLSPTSRALWLLNGDDRVVIPGLARRLTEEEEMLVLSRKLGQSFQIGPDVRVTIVKIDRNSVRIGIHAPDDVSVKRDEIVFELPQSQAPARSYEAGAA